MILCEQSQIGAHILQHILQRMGYVVSSEVTMVHLFPVSVVYDRIRGENHHKITPLWPQVNSEAENFMKPLTKTIHVARTEKKVWKKNLYTFLLNYRATPHTTTGFPPSELLPQVVTVCDKRKMRLCNRKTSKQKQR